MTQIALGTCFMGTPLASRSATSTTCSPDRSTDSIEARQSHHLQVLATHLVSKYVELRFTVLHRPTLTAGTDTS
jgi:hypothetical protein